MPLYILAKPVEVVNDEAGSQVGGNAVKAAAVHNPDALLLGSCMVFVQDMPHPDDFTWAIIQQNDATCLHTQQQR